MSPEFTIAEAKPKIQSIIPKYIPNQYIFKYKGKELDSTRMFNEIGFTSDDPIEIARKNVQKPSISTVNPKNTSEKKRLMRTSPLGECTKPSDNPIYQEALNNLLEMGYPDDLTRAAFRYAGYNPERAAEYLITNNIPYQINLKPAPQLSSIIPVRETEYSEQDKQNIKILTQYSSDRMYILQVYNACDRDLQVSCDLLKNESSRYGGI